MATATELALSPEQAAAVNSDAPAILLTASAGSGKTEVVAWRVERLLADGEGTTSRVLALSYTVKAAEELRQRFDERLGDLARRVDTETLHQFAHELLRKEGTWIGLPAEPEVLRRDEDRAELLAQWLHDEARSEPDDLRRALVAIDLARARGEPWAPYLDEWRAALDAEGALDFGAMIERAIDVLALPSTRRSLGQLYRHIIVDEAQNLTPAQYRLLTGVAGAPPLDGTHVMLVGDDKQSIVGFSGADATLMGTFADRYDATGFHLGVNYRSASKVVELGNAVADQLGAEPAPGGDIYAAPGSITCQAFANEEVEGAAVADWITGLLDKGLDPAHLAEGESTAVMPDQIAVLGRSATSLRATRAVLEAREVETATAVGIDDWLSSIPGRVIPELIAAKVADHRGPKLELARLLGAEADSLSCLDDVAAHLDRRAEDLGRLAPLCHKESPLALIGAIDDVEILDDADWEADRRQLQDAWERFRLRTGKDGRTWGNLWVFLSRLQRANDLTEGVRLLTVHKSQGREYRAVAVVGLNDGQFPDFRATTDEERLGELRAFYVAVTRPTRALYLTRPQERATRFGSRQTDPSPFFDLARPYAE